MIFDFIIILFLFYLKFQIDFFELVFIPAIRQTLFNRGQFGLTPVKNILIPCPLGTKCPLFLMERPSPMHFSVGLHFFSSLPAAGRLFVFCPAASGDLFVTMPLR